jgi:hypothetical protein
MDMINFGSILVDGFVAAIWRVDRDRPTTSASLDVAHLEPLDRAALDEIEAEGERLLAFLEPEATDRSVRIRPLSTA